MGGCGTCKSECGREDGCGTRKAEQTEILDGLIAALYPSRRWGEPDDERCFRGGLGEDEVATLGQQIADVVKAPVYLVPGGPDDLCCFLYVLCIGRAPALVELRAETDPVAEGPGAPGGLTPESASIRERYLRLCCSQVTRAVCVQEVALELDTARSPEDTVGDAGPQVAQIRELPLPGVFDPKLLKRFQKIVDLLSALGIEHLDMGLLDVPASQRGLDSGGYTDRYSDEPALLNFFFYAQPVRTASLSFVPLSLVARAQLAAAELGAAYATPV
jgi:hypothetical protein